MRKHIAAVSVVALAALLGFGVIAGAATLITPVKLKAGMTPRHINNAPFKWKISGKLTLPARVCPAGTTNPAYCSRPPANACSGKVAIGVALGKNPFLADAGKLIIATAAKLNSNCKFSKKIKVPAKYLTTSQKVNYNKKDGYEHVIFGAKYQGNSILTSKTARNQIVIAKIISG